MIDDVNREFQGRFTHTLPAKAGFIRQMDDLVSRSGFNTAVIAFGVGIALYFGWDGEPSLTRTLLVLLALICVRWIARRGFGSAVPLIGLAILIVMGLCRAAWHTAAADSPSLPAAERTYRIEGWVSAIEASGKSERFVVELQSVRGMTVDRMPERLRIRVTKPPEPPIKAGDTINWLVAAKSPPSAVVPGGYNSAQAAYFKGIGGFGFGYGAPEKQADAELGASWSRTPRRYPVAV